MEVNFGFLSMAVALLASFGKVAHQLLRILPNESEKIELTLNGQKYPSFHWKGRHIDIVYVQVERPDEFGNNPDSLHGIDGVIAIVAGLGDDTTTLDELQPGEEGSIVTSADGRGIVFHRNGIEYRCTELGVRRAPELAKVSPTKADKA